MGKPQREVEPFRDALHALRQALGGRIRELRQQRGWSQEEFAAKAHVHRTFAGSLERGEKNCSFHALALISECFGMTLSGMLAGLEAGESAESDTAGQPQPRGDHGDMEWRKVLQEATVLERTAKTLKEIALAQKGLPPASSPERKQRRRKPESKNPSRR